MKRLSRAEKRVLCSIQSAYLGQFAPCIIATGGLLPCVRSPKSPCSIFNLIFSVTARWGSFIVILQKNNISTQIIIMQRREEKKKNNLRTCWRGENTQELSSEACLPLPAPRRGRPESNSFLRRIMQHQPQLPSYVASFFLRTFCLVMHTPLRGAGTMCRGF